MVGFDVEIDYVSDLRVPVSVESDVEEEVADTRLAVGFVVGSIAGSVSGIVTARAPVVANAIWCREVASQGSRAGASGRCYHAIQDG